MRTPEQIQRELNRALTELNLANQKVDRLRAELRRMHDNLTEALAA